MNQTVVDAFQKKVATRSLISEEINKNRIIDNVANKMVFIRLCENCTFIIGQCLKVIIERCRNVTLIITGPVLTGTLEVIQSSNITTISHTKLPTIQIDNTDVCKLELDYHNQMFNIIYCHCRDISITVGTNSSVTLPTMEDVKPNQLMPYDSQLITRFIAGKFVTELLVREGKSGFASESEKRENDARDQRNKELAQAALRDYITVK